MHICTSITFIETSANKFRWKLIIYPHKYLLAVGETGGWIERRTASGKQNLRPLGRLQSVIFKCLSYQTDVNISLWIHKPIIHWQVSINYLFLSMLKTHIQIWNVLLLHRFHNPFTLLKWSFVNPPINDIYVRYFKFQPQNHSIYWYFTLMFNSKRLSLIVGSCNSS